VKRTFFTVQDTEEGMRLDVFLTDKLNKLTRSYIQDLIRGGYVLVNNSKKLKAHYKLKSNDIVDITIPPPKKIEILEEDIPIDILYEDEYLAVIDKPKGMLVHPTQDIYSGTLVNAILYHFDRLSNVGGVLRPGIVHRLDKNTSGLLVIAKRDMIHKALSKQLKDRKMLRIYWAIVEGNIDEDKGVIDTHIGRHPVDRKKMTVIDTQSSRRAITYFKVLKRFGEKYTLVELKLQTGRTHQIRVHMTHIGHPIVGDTVYGSKKQRFKVQGQVLHAKKIGFIHPVTEEYMEFEGELPSYFIKLIKKLEKCYI